VNDLISRSELLKLFPVNLEAPFWHVTGIRAAIGAVDAIDAVSVIRCKDCKNWGTGVAGEIDGIKCCKIAGYMVTMSGYCVYGEVKDDD
jgi:hypothetical protein